MIIELYTVSSTFLFTIFLIDLSIKRPPRIFFCSVLIWFCHVRFSSRRTPRCLHSLTRLTKVPFIWISKSLSSIFSRRCLLPNVIYSVFFMFKCNLFLSNHILTCSRSSFILRHNSLGSFPEQYSIVSSAYMLTLQCFRTEDKSLMWTIYKQKGS